MLAILKGPLLVFWVRVDGNYKGDSLSRTQKRFSQDMSEAYTRHRCYYIGTPRSTLLLPNIDGLKRTQREFTLDPQLRSPSSAPLRTFAPVTPQNKKGYSSGRSGSGWWSPEMRGKAKICPHNSVDNDAKLVVRSVRVCPSSG